MTQDKGKDIPLPRVALQPAPNLCCLQRWPVGQPVPVQVGTGLPTIGADLSSP